MTQVTKIIENTLNIALKRIVQKAQWWAAHKGVVTDRDNRQVMFLIVYMEE